MRGILCLVLLIGVGLAEHPPYMLIRVEPPLDPITREAFFKVALDIVDITDDGQLEIVVHSDELLKIRDLGVSVEIVIEDMEKYYAGQMSSTRNFGGYYTYSESNAILDSLHADYPDITTARIDLAYTTWDGNHLWAIKVSDNPQLEEDEPEILFTGVHHAREPITCNVAVELVRLLCDNYGSDPEITYLVDNRQIWVVPVVNPDGYLYNEQTNPGGGGMWRKNRRDNGGGVYGVDPNRNYAYQWGYDNYGSSGDPSSEVYRGPSVFSEPCTQAMRDLMNAHEFIANVDMHSYGNLVLFPWDYALIFTPDDSLFRALGDDMAALAENATGQVYEYGTSPQVLYACNGTSDDWEYGEHTSKPKIYGYTYEIGESFWQESEIQNHLAEALPMCLCLIKVIGTWLEYTQHTIDDGVGGNGKLDPGETVDMVVTLMNKGLVGGMVNNVCAYLSTDDNYVTVLSDSGYFGDIAPGNTGQNSGTPYALQAHNLAPQGHEVEFTLLVTGSGGYMATTTFLVTIGEPPSPFVIFEDDFEYGGGIDSFPHYWEVTGNWQRSTAESHSATHSAYSGATLDNATYVTLKNAVDLSPFSDPRLGFWHMYNFDQGIFMDDASVQISTNGGSSWSVLWAYDWISGNTLPWAEENFILPPSNNVKIRYAIDGFTFFQDYTDWYIDDFIIGIPTDNEPPYFTNTTVWPDTNFAGPFPVQSMITDASGVDQARLYYRVNGSSWQNVGMTHQGNSVYLGTIPQQNLDDTIDYYLWARDVWVTPNEGTDPVGAPGDSYYSFKTGIIGINEDLTRLIRCKPLGANPANSAICFNVLLPVDCAVQFFIYDVAGRRIHTLMDAPMSPGEYTITWDRKDEQSRTVAAGIYFASFSTAEFPESNTLHKLVLLK